MKFYESELNWWKRRKKKVLHKKVNITCACFEIKCDKFILSYLFNNIKALYIIHEKMSK